MQASAAHTVACLILPPWSQDYEWHVHAPIALKQGIKQDVIDAIADGRRPADMNGDQEICYELTSEINHFKQVSDATYAKAVQRFGEKGVIDLVGINGYCTLLAMTMNTTQLRAPAGGKALKRLPE
jgi:4-carboxymuconolactone decarboxylase